MKTRSEADRMRSAREDAVDWLLRLDEGEPDAPDRETFARWLEADPLHRTAFQEAQQLFRLSGKALADKPEETKRALRGNARRGTALLAALAMLAGATFWLADGPLWLQADAVTGVERTSIIDLPDGSRVHLNANSAIAEDFQPQRRTIRLLRGEAYFEVAPDRSRPFVVEADAIRVRVLGTAFNVNMTAHDTEVTVTENQVEVQDMSGGARVSLTSGERVAYRGDAGLGTVGTVPSGDATPWRRGRLVFEERALERVVEELSRYLPGRYVVMGAALRERRISGSFDLADPQRALDDFAAVFGVRVLHVSALMTLIY